MRRRLASTAVPVALATRVLRAPSLRTTPWVPDPVCGAWTDLFADLVHALERRSAERPVAGGVDALAVLPKLVLQVGASASVMLRRIRMFRAGSFDALVSEAFAAVRAVSKRGGYRRRHRNVRPVVPSSQVRGLFAAGATTAVVGRLVRAREARRSVTQEREGGGENKAYVDSLGNPRSGGFNYRNGNYVSARDPAQVQDRLRAKCPPSRDAQPPRVRSPDAYLNIGCPPGVSPLAGAVAAAGSDGAVDASWRAECRKALTRQADLASPGPSGMRPAHLKALVRTGTREGFDALARLVDVVCAGRAQAWLAASAVVAVPKPDGGVRPIGMGEVVTRVAGRIASRRLVPAVTPSLAAARQYGTVRDGTARVYDDVRAAALAPAAPCSVLKVDITNAFNSLDRSAVLREVGDLAVPAPDDASDLGHPAVPYCRFLYSEPAPLWGSVRGCRPFDLPSGRGVVQGEATAAALFALAVSRVSAAAVDAMGTPPERVVWYADDGFVASPSFDVLRSFLCQFTKRAAEVGLEVNAAKCQLLPADASHRALAEGLGWQVADVMDVVGGPLAAPSHGAEERRRLEDGALIAHAEGVARTVEAIGDISDPQLALYALARAGSCSRARSRMALGIPYPHAAVCILEGADWSAFCRGVLGRDPATISADQAACLWARATLPVRSGGLGIQSVSETLPLVQGQARGRLQDPDGSASRARREREEGRKEQVGASLRALAPDVTLPMRVAHSEAAARGSGLWAAFPPSFRRGTLIDDPEVASWALSLKVGLLPEDLPAAGACPLCSTGQLGPDASHLQLCPSVPKRRHDRVRDVLYYLARRVSHPVGYVPGAASLALELGLRDFSAFPRDGTGDLPGIPGGREGDLVLTEPSRGRLFADVVVTGPTAHVCEAVRASSAPCSPPAPQDGYKGKVAQWKRRNGEGSGCRFLPLAWGASGACHPQSAKGLAKLATALQKAAPLGDPVGATRLYQRMQAAAQVAILGSWGAAAVSAAKSVGRGAAVPTSAAPHAAPRAVADAARGLRALSRWFPMSDPVPPAGPSRVNVGFSTTRRSVTDVSREDPMLGPALQPPSMPRASPGTPRSPRQYSRSGPHLSGGVQVRPTPAGPGGPALGSPAMDTTTGSEGGAGSGWLRGRRGGPVLDLGGLSSLRPADVSAALLGVPEPLRRAGSLRRPGPCGPAAAGACARSLSPQGGDVGMRGRAGSVRSHAGPLSCRGSSSVGGSSASGRRREAFLARSRGDGSLARPLRGALRAVSSTRPGGARGGSDTTGSSTPARWGVAGASALAAGGLARFGAVTPPGSAPGHGAFAGPSGGRAGAAGGSASSSSGSAGRGRRSSSAGSASAGRGSPSVLGRRARWVSRRSVAVRGRSDGGAAAAAAPEGARAALRRVRRGRSPLRRGRLSVPSGAGRRPRQVRRRSPAARTGSASAFPLLASSSRSSGASQAGFSAGSCPSGRSSRRRGGVGRPRRAVRRRFLGSSEPSPTDSGSLS